MPQKCLHPMRKFIRRKSTTESSSQCFPLRTLNKNVKLAATTKTSLHRSHSKPSVSASAHVQTPSSFTIPHQNSYYLVLTITILTTLPQQDPLLVKHMMATLYGTQNHHCQPFIFHPHTTFHPPFIYNHQHPPPSIGKQKS